MSERTQSRPEPAPAVGADDTGWAPLGWTPSDSGWVDDAPFGSVLGDPLMGSPLFDEAAVAEERARRVASYGASPSGGGFTEASGGSGSARAAVDDAASRLRADMDRQQAALRERAAQQQGGPSSSSTPRPVAPAQGYGPSPSSSASYGVAQSRPRGASYSARRQAVEAQRTQRISRQAQPRQTAPRTAREPYATRVSSAQAARAAGSPQYGRALPQWAQDAQRNRPGGSDVPARPAGKRTTTGGASKAGSAIGWIVFLIIILVNVLGR